MSKNVSELLGNSLEKAKGMIDANTVIGDAVTLPDGTVILPVSKISIGVAGGGSDISVKNALNSEYPFGGVSGTGITVTPLAFLVCKENSVRVLPVAEPASTTMDRLIDMVPDFADRIEAYLKERRARNAE